jgi:hypothetical protein
MKIIESIKKAFSEWLNAEPQRGFGPYPQPNEKWRSMPQEAQNMDTKKNGNP